MAETDLELICFEMIASAGESKSNYMEALQAVKEKNFELADKLIKDGDSSFKKVHEIHSSLIQKEASGEKIQINLLMVHVEDQMMSVEIIKILVLEFYELYKNLNEVK